MKNVKIKIQRYRVTITSAFIVCMFIVAVVVGFFLYPKIKTWVKQVKWTIKASKNCRTGLSRNQEDKCFRSMLKQAVKEEGTLFSIELLSLLRKKNIITAQFDDHQHVHEIGRATAEYSGINIYAFLLCPSTFNYGCQHGFFEYALSRKDSYKEAVETICENLPKDKPQKWYAYCYHGVGHGIMMAKAYNLKESLAVCDDMLSSMAQQSCWQGVFMENMNAAVSSGKKETFGFSKSDLLSPCNKMQYRYAWQCYINHAGYLITTLDLNIRKVAETCLHADEKGMHACLQSIGLITTNPLWQKDIKGVDTHLRYKKNAQIAWELCQEMPHQARTDCVIGAVDNILNFDGIDITRVSFFCDLVSTVYQQSCFAAMGKSLVVQVIDQNSIHTICNKIKKKDRSLSCITGAGLFPKQTISQKEGEQLISDDMFLKKSIKEAGPSKVIQVLASVTRKTNTSCHKRAHETGRFAYELLGERSFTLCSSECHSGCYHGATEAFFKDKGTDALQDNLAIICQGELNRFFKHQCIHGVGHGLMAWSNYELFEALLACDQLGKKEDQASCWTGVFMENIVGGLTENKKEKDNGHFTRYLNQNAHYPCTVVPEKYKGSCYFLQTSRMLQLFNGDFSHIARSCGAAPYQYQSDCFLSMGRDAGGISNHKVEDAIQKCQFAPSGMPRTQCLSGAVQDTFWDASGKNEAIRFCSLLSHSEERSNCYTTIAQRASEILPQTEYQTFCQHIERFGNFCASIFSQKSSTQSSNTVNQSLPPVDNKPTLMDRQRVSIVIGESGFTPSVLKIKNGTEVTFTNESSESRWPASNIHPTHAIYPEFDPKKPIQKGSVWVFKFGKKGIWKYHDHLDPSLIGTIEVVEE